MLRDMADGDKLYKHIADSVSGIPAEHKTPEAEYLRRLGICKVCEHLLNGMCSLCGCFPEYRAAKIGQSCVNNYW